MSSNSRLPVLVVGAGPTGLVTALTLLKHGVPVRIIQKDDRFHIGQRGAGIQPRTLEVYNLLGILPDIKEHARPFMQIRLYKTPGGVEPLRTFWLIPPGEPTPSTPYASVYLLGQAHAEEILRCHLAKYGVQVELSTELSGLEQDEDHVTAKLIKRRDGQEVEEIVKCDWLVGADGGRGVVRKLAGLTFSGEALTAQLIFGEIRVQGLTEDYWHAWGNPSKTMVTLRPTEYDGLFSYIIMGRDVDYAKVSADNNELVRVLRETTDRPDLVFGEIMWKTDYRPSARMVNKFFDRRVFVAGDAAHIHSPTGGQGMNSSIQDALNLGWKLALVHKGLASPSLLATYEEERLPVIRSMLEKTTTLFNRTFGESSQSQQMDGWATGQSNMPGLSMLGVNYRWSSVVIDERAPPVADEDRPKALDAYGIESDGEVRAGDRAPDAPGLFHVGEGDERITSLFEHFAATHHTVLVFSAYPAKSAEIVEALKEYPKDLVGSLVIYPQGTQGASAIAGAGFTLVDKERHAYRGYSIVEDKTTVVVVRPDGVIGAIVFGRPGLQKYFKSVLSL